MPQGAMNLQSGQDKLAACFANRKKTCGGSTRPGQNVRQVSHMWLVPK